jgi:hypothetical protein
VKHPAQSSRLAQITSAWSTNRQQMRRAAAEDAELHGTEDVPLPKVDGLSRIQVVDEFVVDSFVIDPIACEIGLQLMRTKVWTEATSMRHKS